MNKPSTWFTLKKLSSKDSKQAARLLDLSTVLQEFDKAEKSHARPTGTFKINAPFVQALDTNLKPKPQPKKNLH
ncbi:MAG: hypothetical protein DMG21_12420 [Acidobacteria bacterium]|nr:MAG: hypothetical protein DMG21_12420 [Acidobacteriota bacterium]